MRSLGQHGQVPGARGTDPSSAEAKRPRTASRESVRALVRGLPLALASWTPLWPGTSFPLTLNSCVWEETGQGWALGWNLTHPHPQAPAEPRPAQFRAAVVLPRPPHPTSCKSLSQQAQKIRQAIFGWERKNPSSCGLIGILNS